MNAKRGTLSAILLIAVVLAATGYFLFWRNGHDVSGVSVSTDKGAYSTQDTLHITIRNRRDRSIDIYCPSVCNLGNVPTTVESWLDGEWRRSGMLCPWEPSLSMRMHVEDDYIRHTLPPQGTPEVNYQNLKYAHIQAEKWWRLVYYLGPYRVPVYSNAFVVKP